MNRASPISLFRDETRCDSCFRKLRKEPAALVYVSRATGCYATQEEALANPDGFQVRNVGPECVANYGPTSPCYPVAK